MAEIEHYALRCILQMRQCNSFVGYIMILSVTVVNGTMIHEQ